MKKYLKLFLICAVLLPCLTLLSACGQKVQQTKLFETKFSNGNQEVFKVYGSVTDNEDGTITVMADNNNSGPVTFFGTSNKNLKWNGKPITTKLGIIIDSQSMQTNDYFNITQAINSVAKENEEYSYRSERSIYFRKYETGVRVGYEYNGSSDEINATATSNNTSVLLQDGEYTVIFKLYENNEGNMVYNISLQNKQGKTVFKVENCGLETGEELKPTKAEEIGGIRYLWFSRLNTSVKVTYLGVFEAK